MRNDRNGWIFLIPIIAIDCFVILILALWSVFYSFTDWSGIGTADFIGLGNYVKLLTDRIYIFALFNNVKWMVFFVTVPVFIGLLISRVLMSLTRGQMIFRVIFFVPYILPSIVNANLWKNILSPTFGVLPWLNSIGLNLPNVKFFANREIVLFTIASIDSWRFWGFLVVLYLASLQNIPKDFYEVASLEGANRWQEFLHVTIPGMLPTLMFTLVMIVIWSFLAFDYVYILTQGGPAHTSELLGTLAYKTAFDRYEMGYASAISISMSFFCIISLLIFHRIKKSGYHV